MVSRACSIAHVSLSRNYKKDIYKIHYNFQLYKLNVIEQSNHLNVHNYTKSSFFVTHLTSVIYASIFLYLILHLYLKLHSLRITCLYHFLQSCIIHQFQIYLIISFTWCMMLCLPSLFYIISSH